MNKKRLYSKPIIESYQLDKEIVMVMDTGPIVDPPPPFAPPAPTSPFPVDKSISDGYPFGVDRPKY